MLRKMQIYRYDTPLYEYEVVISTTRMRIKGRTKVSRKATEQSAATFDNHIIHTIIRRRKEGGL